MGRAYLAYCAPDERDAHLRRFRADPERGFGPDDERDFSALLAEVRRDGYAMRDPRTKPYRTTTLAVPILAGGEVHALASISIFTTAVPRDRVVGDIVDPLKETCARIGQALAYAPGHYPVANGLADETASF